VPVPKWGIYWMFDMTPLLSGFEPASVSQNFIYALAF
jgi:hypothetical protein